MSKKFHEAAAQIAQSNHEAVTPTALLARILELESKSAPKAEKPVKPAKK